MRSKIGRFVGAAVIGVTVILAVAGCGGSSGDGGGLGKPGQPVHLVVGYQPYYTEGWSGLVLKQTQLWKKYLPKGSTVQFQVGLQGSIIVSQMLAGKQQIGYLGDMPAIVGASKRSIRDLRIVASIGISSDQCGVFLVSKNAPQFSSQIQAIKWLNGRTVATPQGSCADRVAQDVFQHEGVTPKAYLNQSIDLITSDFRSGSIQGASTWEPSTSQLIDSGLARRVASGNAIGLSDAAFIDMSHQLLTERPDIAKDWLKAELAAERYLADPANAASIVNMALTQTTGYTAAGMRHALYRAWPSSAGGAANDVKLTFPFIVNGTSAGLIKSATSFLYKIHSLASPQLPPGAVDGTVAQQVLKQSGYTDPVGAVKGQGGT
jgi:NitT/TauT family transport system substrate-binding protein